MLIGVILIVRSTMFASHSDMLSIGVTFDLLLTIPLVYFLLIRKTKIPKTTVVPVLIIGILIGSLLLPNENQYFLNLFKTWALPVIEISVLAFVVFKVIGAIKEYRRHREIKPDFYTALKDTCYQILPKQVVMLVVTDIAVFYYGFINWGKRDLKKNEFTYHKDSGTISLLGAFIFLIVIETFVFHLLLAIWSSIAAWILSGLSIYMVIQVFGLIKSILKRPISIEEKQLKLRYGILNETTIDLDTIVSVELSGKSIEFDNETRKLSPLGELESHKVIIRLNRKNNLHGLFGIKRSFKTLALYVDNKEEFKNQVEKNALRQKI